MPGSGAARGGRARHYRPRGDDVGPVRRRGEPRHQRDCARMSGKGGGALRTALHPLKIFYKPPCQSIRRLRFLNPVNFLVPLEPSHLAFGVIPIPGFYAIL